MKYKVTRQELNECIAEAVAKVLKEDKWDDELNAALASDPKRAKAEKAAKKDSDKEAAEIAADDAKIEGGESEEMNTSDEDIPTASEVDPKNLPFEELVNPKNIRQARAFKTELLKRERIKQEYEEDGIQPEWGYTIDDNGNVQPTHTDLGRTDMAAFDGRGGDFSGLNFGWGHNSAD